jgi:hypothetical protein
MRQSETETRLRTLFIATLNSATRISTAQTNPVSEDLEEIRGENEKKRD